MYGQLLFHCDSGHPPGHPPGHGHKTAWACANCNLFTLGVSAHSITKKKGPGGVQWYFLPYTQVRLASSMAHGCSNKMLSWQL